MQDEEGWKERVKIIHRWTADTGIDKQGLRKTERGRKLERQADRQMEGWMDGCMDGWMDEYTHRLTFVNLHL